MDGFAPFKKCKHTCYNLFHKIWFLIWHIICIGVILGPKKPKDFDSFLWTLVEELLELTSDVQAFDITTNAMFTLLAFLIVIFGDMPAILMVQNVLDKIYLNSRCYGQHSLCPT